MRNGIASRVISARTPKAHWLPAQSQAIIGMSLTTPPSINGLLLLVLYRHDECFLWSVADDPIFPQFPDLAR